MTFSSLLLILQTASDPSAPVYRDRVPERATRYIAVTKYGSSPILGDSTNVADITRVQIDIYTQTEDDVLPGQVIAALRANHMPYVLAGEGVWDEDRLLYRTVLTTETVL